MDPSITAIALAVLLGVSLISLVRTRRKLKNALPPPSLSRKVGLQYARLDRERIQAEKATDRAKRKGATQLKLAKHARAIAELDSDALRGQVQRLERRLRLRSRIPPSSNWARVAAVFGQREHGPMAGCFLERGEIRDTDILVVVRGEKELFCGRIKALEHDGKAVRVAKKDMQQCDIAFDGFDDFMVGDKVFVSEAARQIPWPIECHGTVPDGISIKAEDWVPSIRLNAGLPPAEA